MSVRRVSIALALCLAMTVGAENARAQFAPGARSAGMAGAGLVFATGTDAVEWNPANLAWSNGWEVSLFEFGASSLLNGTTISDLIDIAGGDAEGSSAVDRLPADGFTLSTTAEGFAVSRAASAADLPEIGAPIPTVGIAIGPVALRVRSRLMSEVSISKEIADLVVNEYNPERIQEYAVRNTSYRAASFSEITLGYGFTIGERFALGVGARWIQGHSLSQGRFFEPVVDLDERTLAVTAAAVESPSGSGYGFDAGLALDLGGGVRMSMSGTNLFQRMTWDEELVAHQAVFSDGDFDDADITDLIDRFEDMPVEAQAASLAVFEAGRGLFEQSYFPMTIRTGIGWSAGGTTVELVGVGVSSRGRHHNAWDERVSAGVEQRLGFVALRAGYSLANNGLKSAAAGLGLGFGPVKLEVSAGRISGEFAGIDYDGAHVTIALSVRGGGL